MCVCVCEEQVGHTAAFHLLQIPEEKMSGKLILSPEFPDHSSFIVGKDRSTVVCVTLYDV